MSEAMKNDIPEINFEKRAEQILSKSRFWPQRTWRFSLSAWAKAHCHPQVLPGAI